MRRLFQLARSSRRNSAGKVTSRSTARPARAESSMPCPNRLQEDEGASKPSRLLSNQAALSAALGDFVVSVAIAAPVTVEPFEAQSVRIDAKSASCARWRFATSSTTATLITAVLLGLSTTRYTDQDDTARISPTRGQVFRQETRSPSPGWRDAMSRAEGFPGSPPSDKSDRSGELDRRQYRPVKSEYSFLRRIDMNI
jgi:hypothetical protein